MVKKYYTIMKIKLLPTISVILSLFLLIGVARDSSSICDCGDCSLHNLTNKSGSKDSSCENVTQSCCSSPSQEKSTEGCCGEENKGGVCLCTVVSSQPSHQTQSKESITVYWNKLFKVYSLITVFKPFLIIQEYLSNTIVLVDMGDMTNRNLSYSIPLLL